MNDTKALKGKISAQALDGLKIIDISHKAVHDGKAFSVIAEKLNLASEGTFDILFQTNGKEVHLRPAVLNSSASYVKAELFEGAVYTEASGTELTSLDHNRQTDNQSQVVIKSDANFSADGIQLPIILFAGTEGQPQARSGGTGDAEHEQILKLNTTYLIRVTNMGATVTDVTIIPFWYEVEY